LIGLPYDRLGADHPIGSRRFYRQPRTWQWKQRILRGTVRSRLSSRPRSWRRAGAGTAWASLGGLPSTRCWRRWSCTGSRNHHQLAARLRRSGPGRRRRPGDERRDARHPVRGGHNRAPRT